MDSTVTLYKKNFENTQMMNFTPSAARKGSSLLFAKRINSFFLHSECNVSVGFSFRQSVCLPHAIFANPGFNIICYGERRYAMEIIES